jgi:hypothetical protein
VILTEQNENTPALSTGPSRPTRVNRQIVSYRDHDEDEEEDSGSDEKYEDEGEEDSDISDISEASLLPNSHPKAQQKPSPINKEAAIGM